MGKKSKMDIERAKQQMSTAHEKRLQQIDSILARVKNAEVMSYEKKMQMLDKAAQKIAAAKPAAEEVKATVTETVSEVTEAAGKARKKAGRRIKRQPWIVALAASAFLLALGVSVGRKYFSPDYAGGSA